MNQFRRAKQKALDSGHQVENITDIQTAGVKEPAKEEKNTILTNTVLLKKWGDYVIFITSKWKENAKKMSLSETIKLTRQKLFMSQEDFASKIHVSVATINRWENGRSKPNLIAMKSIKTFCEENNLSFSEIENEWHKASGGEEC